MPAKGPVPVVQDRDLALEILRRLGEKSSFRVDHEFAEVSHSDAQAALNKLASRSMIEYEQQNTEAVILEKEGLQIVAEGSHEYKVWNAIRSAGGKLAINDLAAAVGPESAKFGQGSAMRNR